MRRIRKDDDVIIIAGRDKGKRGTVLNLASEDRVYVRGVNIVKRHTKANPNMGVPGGIIEKEAPIHISNLMLFNSKKGSGDRVGFKVQEGGKKVRVFKSDGSTVDV